ncbi:hypothetical protein WBJ53_30585 [Spirosoma sp. SC4-14]|uniref:hypothetical protein n=1 Tax=Spirosoma sp. SC4-14 TaxID=3128900 RepID=UPI0030CE3086
MNNSYYNTVANTEARPVSLQEIEEYLRWLTDSLSELDTFLSTNLETDLEYKPIFLDRDLTFDRTFIGHTILKLNAFRNSIGQGLFCTSKLMTYCIDSKDADDLIIVNFKKDFKTLEFAVIFYIRAQYLGLLTGKVNIILSTIWDLFLKVESDYIKRLDPKLAREKIKAKLLELEESKIKSPKLIYLWNVYREKEHEIYNLLKEYFLDDSVTEEKILVNVILKSLKKVQGLGIHISSYEKARTKLTTEFIQNFIAKDESDYGFSENLKTIGEVDILIEKTDGNAVAICEGFNLKKHFNKPLIINHINKLFTYDVNGLKANFIIAYVETSDFNKLWDKYYSFIQTISTPYNLIETVHLSHDWPDLPTDIKLCRLTYSRNGLKTVVYHMFAHMSPLRV